MVYEIKIFIKLSVNIPFRISDSDQNKLRDVYEYRFHSDCITKDVFDILKDKIERETGLECNMYHYNIYPRFNLDRGINTHSNKSLDTELKNGIHDDCLPLVLIVDNIQPLLEHFNISNMDDPEICPVCLNTSTQFAQPYLCSHIICVDCYEECVSHSLLNCSLCRSASRLIVNGLFVRYNNIMR
jgi:hypothetical protein